MKVAISADDTNLDAQVSHRFGTSPYFIITDLETGEIETVENPGSSGKRGAGVEAILLAISKDVKVVLTGYCSPAARRNLESNGIEVTTGLSGTAGVVLERYRKGEVQKPAKDNVKLISKISAIERDVFSDAIKRSGNQLASMLPILAGVVLLIGLFNTFVPKEFLASLFTGNAILDTLWGACFGSILAGNPVNSYVIGGELLGHGVSLFAVTALIITWVTVGIVQMPAEMAALGRRFAILRNALCFMLSLPTALITVVILNIVTG
jgi:predicted Fe-Mo cluster-binding NifX family protein